MTSRLRALCVLALSAALLALMWPAPAAAHPLGNFTINRFSELRAGLTEVGVLYVVDMAEIPTFQERDRIDSNGDDDVRASELEGYAAAIAPRLARSLRLTSSGEALRLVVEESSAELRPGQGGLEVLRIEVRLRAGLPSQRALLEYRDLNYSQRLGWKEIVALGVGGQGLARSSVPSRSVSDELSDYPKDLLSSPLSLTEARIELSPQAPATVGVGPDEVAEAPVDLVGGWFSSLIERELSFGFAFVALGLALGAGALHALGPGHGKTIMAAYLVGADGRMRHAVMVGVAVSVMHTTSVVVLGVITLWASSLFPPETVFPWLSLASGTVVLGLGLWLLGTRLRARYSGDPGHSHAGHSHARQPQGHDHSGPSHTHEPHNGHSHAHEPHDHDHDHGRAPGGSVGVLERVEAEHGHSHAPPPDTSPFSARGLAAVALSGGLLPSPSALVVLLGAVALQRVAFGLALVGAFSIGLAGALTAIGILVLKARDVAARCLSTRAGALIPIGSAALIVGVGLFLTTRALMGL